MKKVLIVLIVILVAYFGYKSFMIPNDEQVLENTLKKMAILDAEDTQSDVSEKDVMFEDEKTSATTDTMMKKEVSPTTKPATSNTETSASIDAALADMSLFSGTESSDPFDGL